MMLGITGRSEVFKSHLPARLNKFNWGMVGVYASMAG